MSQQKQTEKNLVKGLQLSFLTVEKRIFLIAHETFRDVKSVRVETGDNYVSGDNYIAIWITKDATCCYSGTMDNSEIDRFLEFTDMNLKNVGIEEYSTTFVTYVDGVNLTTRFRFEYQQSDLEVEEIPELD